MSLGLASWLGIQKEVAGSTRSFDVSLIALLGGFLVGYEWFALE